MAKVDLKQVKIDLAAKIDELRRLVDDNTGGLTSDERARYEKAIGQLEAARAVMSSVACDPPNMSFEIPPPPALRQKA
jgi:hypothetical protein